MKKLILSLFILILSAFCYENVYAYAQSNQMGQESNYRIGYTTKYGNSFGQTTQYSQPTFYRNQSYTSAYSPTPSLSSGPRRSAERPYSGGRIEDLLDWLRINTDSNWPSYVDEDYWDELKNIDPDAYDYAVWWYENQGKHFPGDPNDPFPTPVGNIPICMFICLTIVYVIYKRKPWRSNL